MYGHPFYRNYPPGVSYNPYAPYGYGGPAAPAYPHERPMHSRGRYTPVMDDARARQLAAQRARRAQWLPDEDDEDEDMYDDDGYGGFDPRERVYAEAQRRQAMLEQQRKEAEAAAAAARDRERERERKWQEELEKRKREDEERRAAILQEKRRLKKERQEKQEPEQETRPTESTPAHINEETAKQRVYTEEEEEAARRIQHQWRIHQSLSTLKELKLRFEELRKGFVYPSVIDFVRPGTSADQQAHGEGGTVSVRATHPPSDYPGDGTAVECDGKLAYTSTNYGLHQYVDGLERLLLRLDGVESWGNRGVRERRRRIVSEISKEASRVEWYWKTGYNNNR